MAAGAPGSHRPTLASIAEDTMAYWQKKHAQAVTRELDHAKAMKWWRETSSSKTITVSSAMMDLVWKAQASSRSNPAWGYMQRTTE